MLFWVLPGGALKVLDLVRKVGWPPAALDLVPRGEGDYVVAPPSRVGSRGPVLWARQPTSAKRWLPDVEELASALADAAESADRPSSGAAGAGAGTLGRAGWST